MSRKAPPFWVVAIAVFLLLLWYVIYTQRAVSELRKAAQLQGQMSSRIYSALADTSSTEGTRIQALIELARLIRESGVPLILTDPSGAVVDTANIPFSSALEGEEIREYIRTLDKMNVPIAAEGAGTIHYGDSRLVKGLSTVPVLQTGAIGLLLLVGLWGLKERGRAEREKVWAGMARESAHQIGTPLSSLAGWIELLSEKGDDPEIARAVDRMSQDLVRLDRVAHRFERIGRPPRSDDVDLNAMVERMASYFAVRVPVGSRKVTVRAEPAVTGLTIKGDAVLLEWVLEVLVKNSIDALGGRGGDVTLGAAPLAEGGAILTVSDNGPGVPKEFRKKIFEAGYSTKERGWGIGLALARRIVEENHGGRLILADKAPGASFEVILSR